MTMTTFELWVHKELHEFAVRIEDGHVTGICPVSLHCACDPDDRLPSLDFDGSDAALYRVRYHLEQFFQFEPTLQARYVPVTVPRGRRA